MRHDYHWLVASIRTSNFGNLNATFKAWFQQLYDLQHLATFSMITTAYWKTQLRLNVASCDKPNLSNHIHEWENHGNHPWKIYEQIRLRRSQLSLKFCRCLLQLWDLRVCEANLFNQKVSSSNIHAAFYGVRFKKFRGKSQHLLDLLRWKVILRPWRHRYVMTWPSSKLLMANLKGCKWIMYIDFRQLLQLFWILSTARLAKSWRLATKATSTPHKKNHRTGYSTLVKIGLISLPFQDIRFHRMSFCRTC